VIVVAAGHPWRKRRRPISAHQLAATPLLLREPGSGTREVLIDALEAHGLGATAAMELGSTTAIKAAAMSGAAPTVVSALAVRAELRAGQLVVINCDDLHLGRKIRAIWTPGRPHPPAVARLLAIASRNDKPVLA
jgi:DNA-binding transcriptional LysR family regulator